MTKKLFALAVVVALTISMSACSFGGKVRKVYNSCGDIITCAVNTPNEYNQQVAPELQQLNNQIFGGK